MDYTFSEATDELLKNGFVLCDERKWRRKIEDAEQLQRIFILPDSFIVAIVTSIYQNLIWNTQMYFSWKPKGPVELSILKDNGKIWYLSDIELFYNSSSGIKVFDEAITSFPRIKSRDFKTVLNYYLLSKYLGFFVPWKPNPNFSLLAPYESENFTYNYPQVTEIYSEKDIKNQLMAWITDERRRKDRELSDQRLLSILANLKLNPQNYGL
jgi:hypothetical protein